MKATNKLLSDLFNDIDIIQIKNDGVQGDKAISNDIVLRIDEPSTILDFKRLVTIIEPEEDFQCMCLGDYAIELLQENKLKHTIGFHHGVSIRFHQWSGDAELKYADELLTLLFDLGLKEPLEQKKLEHKRAKESEKESNNWLGNSPKSFSKYWNEINSFDESYIPKLKKDLEEEFNKKEDLIIALLTSFGTSNNLWTAFPMYELTPQMYLDEYTLQDILDAFFESNKDQLTRIGLGRYLFSWDFRKQIKKHHKKLTIELLKLLSEAFEKINNSKGIESVERLIMNKKS